MGIFTKRKPKEVNRRESLAGIPVRSESLAVLEKDDGSGSVVKIRVPRSAHFLDRFRPAVMEKRFELDELGTYVLGLIDGKKSSRELVDAFASDYGVNRREAELSVVSFLKMLMQRQVISIVVDSQ